MIKKLFLLVLVSCLGISLRAQEDHEEWYRFQLTGFGGLSTNFGKSYQPQDQLQVGLAGQSSTRYFGVKETGAYSRGFSILSFPSFLRYGRFSIVAGIGIMQLNYTISADSMVNEWSSGIPPQVNSGRTVTTNPQWKLTDNFFQLPVLFRSYFFRYRRFFAHADIGFVTSFLMKSDYWPLLQDRYNQSIFGSSFYTADVNISYRVLSNSHYGLFLTAGLMGQAGVYKTEQGRRTGIAGGLFGVRFDMY